MGGGLAAGWDLESHNTRARARADTKAGRCVAFLCFVSETHYPGSTAAPCVFSSTIGSSPVAQ